MEPGDLKRYVGAPVIAPLVKRAKESWGWESGGWGEIPENTPCFVLEHDEWPGFWIVKVGSDTFRIHERVLVEWDDHV